MRVLCCLNRDLASNLALNLLLPALRRHEVLVGLTERVGSASRPAQEPPARAELRAAEQTLPNEVLFPLVERANLADDGARLLTFAEIERHRGPRLTSLSSPNAGTGLDAVRDFAPDLILTIRYGAILREAVIAIPRYGVINLHSGALPSYRGVLATFRALSRGDNEIRCTLHYIADAGIDTGDIIGTRTVPVDRERSLLWHILALYGPGIALMSDVLADLAAGRQPPRTQQATTGGAYYSYPSAQEWAAFTDQGWRIADARDLLEIYSRYTD